MTRRTASSKPGRARRALRAARSAGCSQAREVIAVSFTVSGIRSTGLRTRTLSGPYGAQARLVSSSDRRFFPFCRSSAPALRHAIERPFQVRQQIIGVLHAAGQADEAVRDPEIETQLRRD